MSLINSLKKRQVLLILLATLSLAYVPTESFACIPVEEGTDLDSLPEPLRNRMCPSPAFNQMIDELDNIVTPTKKLSLKQYPEFTDDMAFENMLLAIDRQIARFQQRDLSKNIQYGNDVYKQSILLKTMEHFKGLVINAQSCLRQSRSQDQMRACFNTLNSEIKSQYNVYVPNLAAGDPRFGEPKDTFFTAYYSPTLEARREPSNEFRYAIYARPQKESLAQSTRNQIDFKDTLANRGFEIYYTNDLFDLYLMQVQGSGMVRLDRDGQLKEYMSYGGTNKQTWNWISKYMVAQGYIPDLSIYAQREFLDMNPQKHEEVYSSCPSYVYFRKTETPPVGSDMVPVTTGRSIATDSVLYARKGALAFIQAMRPVEGQEDQDPRKNPIQFKSFSRFVIDQDTGGAIKGKGRVDIYQGDDEYARVAAFNTQHPGNLYFLILKNK